MRFFFDFSFVLLFATSLIPLLTDFEIKYNEGHLTACVVACCKRAHSEGPFWQSSAVTVCLLIGVNYNCNIDLLSRQM